MKKLASPFLAAFAALFLAVPASAADAAPEVSAHAAIVMHADTLEVLYEKRRRAHADRQHDKADDCACGA